MKSVEQLARSLDPAMVRAFGAIRRFVVTLTDQTLWQIAGVLMPDGREAFRAEVFGGVGFYARPSTSGSPEAIVAMANGDATNPVIVAVRDEKTRQAIIKALGGEPAADTTFVNNSVALMLIKPDGTIEARSATGTAHVLALKSDVDALASYIDQQFSTTGVGHSHTVDVADAITIATSPAAPGGGGGSGVPSATGTKKLKGE